MEIKPGYKQTEIGVIPEEWDAIKLGKLSTFVSSGKSKKRTEHGEYHFYGSTGIIGYCDTPEYDGERILIARVGANAGSLYTVDGRYSVSDNTLVIGLKDSNLTSYIANYLLKENLNRIVFGSGQPLVTGNQLKNVMIAMPSQREEIYSIVEAISNVVALITSLEKQIEKKKLIKQGVMQELLTGKRRLPGFSREWEIKRLGNIASIKKGQQLNSDSFGDYGIYPVMNGGISPSGYTNDFNADGHTLIISEGGNSCGYVNYVDGRFWQGGHCYSIATNQDSLFLYYSLKYRESEIMGLRVGSGLPNVQKKRLSDFPILVPTIEEQSGIALILKGFDSAIIAYEQSLAKHILLKQAMMQELLTGRIRLI